MFCHKCGNKIAEGAEFCHKCGTKIVIDEAPAQQTYVEPNPPTIAPEPTYHNYQQSASQHIAFESVQAFQPAPQPTPIQNNENITKGYSAHATDSQQAEQSATASASFDTPRKTPTDFKSLTKYTLPQRMDNQEAYDRLAGNMVNAKVEPQSTRGILRSILLIRNSKSYIVDVKNGYVTVRPQFSRTENIVALLALLVALFISFIVGLILLGILGIFSIISTSKKKSEAMYFLPELYEILTGAKDLST